jgi:hypothetical protein
MEIIEKIVNVETGSVEVIERQMTDGELAAFIEWQRLKELEDAEEQERQAREAKKQEVLTKLGLTADEAQALLG